MSDRTDQIEVGFSGREPDRPAASGWLGNLGRRSWLFVGVVVAASIVFSALAALSGLVVPLVVSVVLGVLLVPLVDRFQRMGVPRKSAATLVMVGLAAVAAGSVWITVAGVIDQGPEISRQVGEGVETIETSLADAGLLLEGTGSLGRALDVVPEAARGVAGYVSSVFSGVISFVVGMFVGTFFFYYMLTDWERLVGWVARNLGIPEDLGAPIIDDTVRAIREYFRGLTISSIIVSIVIGVTMWALGLPLGVAIALVTFVTGYIPYVGAVFSGTFAFLVAVGSGGMEKALVVLLVVLVAQNAIQTLVQNKLTSDQLSIHPIVNFGSTLVGITLAGVLGATLSAPIVASLIRMSERVRSYKWHVSGN
ncbi:MAG: AI-2E family transporter [Acidimicrobiia bacterium]|nr:AI-2E family transporter [Acidimicrobiia bacterium]MDH4306698.1 AI-2E family transporter [Acidimicrobiia bacterium]